MNKKKIFAGISLAEAGIVAPPGYPESIDINSLDTSDWCTVSEQLQDSRG